MGTIQVKEDLSYTSIGRAQLSIEHKKQCDPRTMQSDAKPFVLTSLRHVAAHNVRFLISPDWKELGACGKQLLHQA